MSDLHSRLELAIGKTTFRRLGDLTDTHPETVRRYMQGQSPSAQFLSMVCEAFGINGEWLLTGKGPMKVNEMRQHALRQADMTELLVAIAENLSSLGERMDRLEKSVQQLDSKLRAPGDTPHGDAAQSGAAHGQGASEPGMSPSEAAGRIRDAVSKRSTTDSQTVRA